MAKSTSAFKFKYEIPKEMLDGFKQLQEEVRKKAVRKIMRSAIVPAQKHLKANLRQLRRKSENSTGAALRATTTKTKIARGRNYIYSMVSIDRRWAEALTREPAETKTPKNQPQRMVNVGVFIGYSKGVRTRYARIQYPRYKKRPQPGNTKNYAGRAFTRRNRQAIGRVPNKYWHLSEFGFSHTKGFFKKTKRGYFGKKMTVKNARGRDVGVPSGKRFDGHHFIEQTYNATYNQCLSIIEQRFREAVER